LIYHRCHLREAWNFKDVGIVIELDFKLFSFFFLDVNTFESDYHALLKFVPEFLSYSDPETISISNLITDVDLLPETALCQAQDFTNNIVIIMFKVEK